MKILNELALKYNIDINEFKRIVAQSVEKIMSLYYNSNFECSYENDNFIIKKIKTNGTIVEFTLINLSSDMKKLIVKEVSNNLINSEIRSVYERIKSLRKGLIYGKIFKILNNDVLVEFLDYNNNPLIAILPSSGQVAAERHKYKIGEKFAFYCSKIYIKEKSIVISLSRSSIKLPELILKEKCNSLGIEMKFIKCVKRFIWQCSFVFVPRTLPQKAIQEASYELTEKIIPIKMKDMDFEKIQKRQLSWKNAFKLYVR